MALTDAQLLELSKLVDTLQALPEVARVDWLAALGPDQAVFRPTLQRLLADGGTIETRDFLATLPKLDDIAEPDSSGLAAGSEIGPYSLLRELGHGGMGTVWLAQRSDGMLKRAVALKLPHSALPQRQLAERFGRERDILASLTHPNIARLYDAGVTAQGQPYLALEYVEGEPLLTWCDGHRLGVRERIELFLQALAAVQYAHGQLVIHRDLKPSNMLVTAQGEVQLLDFGIAKLLTSGGAKETEMTQLGGRVLTPQYASPEQITGQPISTASDVYSLGVVLYELLTGALPYRVKRDSRGALEDAILTAEPVKPSQAVGDPALAAARATTAIRIARDLKGDLDTIALKALKKKPEERYATADAFAADLRRYLAGEPVQARPDSTWYRARKFAGRNRLAVGAAMVVALALSTGFGIALWQAGVAREQAALAREEARTTKAVHDFLTDIFTANSSNQTNPQKARQTTARELLDIGAAKIDTSLKDAPEAKAAVLRLVSNMYAELGLNELAAQFAEQRVALLRTLRGPDHPEIADQLVEVSQMIQSTNRSAERGPLLREALRIMDLHPEGDRKTQVRVLRQLALLEHDTRDPRALEHAQQAVALASTRSSEGLVEALIVLGKVQADSGDNPGAEKTLLRSLELFSTAPEVSRRSRIILFGYLGDAQFALGKIAAAETSFREGLALAFKVSGPDHIDAAQMEFRFGQFLFDTARTADGLALLESAHVRVVRTRGANNNSFLPNVLRVESSMRADLGDLESALPLAQNGLRLLGTTGHDRNIARLLLQQAVVTIEMGLTAEAKAALERIDANEHEVETLNAEERELRQLLAARMLLAENRPDAARAILDQARNALDRERHSFAEWNRLLQWGELALDSGDPRTALTTADRALKQIAADPAPKYLELREQLATSLAGKAHLAMDDAAAAIPLLRRAVVLAEAHLDRERSPRLADALIALAQACRQTRQYDTARQALSKAKSILARHPALASQHRRQWEETRKQLIAAK
jgi:eukaryotic-like serine/threonine-protein kinase